MFSKMKYLFLSLFAFSLAWGEDCKDNGAYVDSGEEGNKPIYLGKEKHVRGNDTIEVDVYMYWRDRRRQELLFEKKGKGLKIDSIVFSNGVYSIDEKYQMDEKHTLSRTVMPPHLEETSFYIFDDKGNTIQWYIVGVKKEYLYDEYGKLLPLFTEVRGDTAFCDLEYGKDGHFGFIN